MQKPELLSKRAFFLVVAGLLILCRGNAFGAIIYIPDKYPTIQQAIDAAFEGDTIIVRDGTYLLTAAIDFKGKAITLKSQNGASNCILDGQQKTRVVYFHGGETNSSVLSGFTIQNGSSDKGGGIYCEQSSPTITQCLIRRNAASADYAYGAGIYCMSASPIIINCTISANRASGAHQGAGGGVYSNASSPKIISSSITGNTAYAAGYSNGYTLVGGVGNGGGICAEGGAQSIADTGIIGNTASAYGSNAIGGGIYGHVSSINIANCSISNNSSDAQGGGAYLDSSFASVTNDIFSGNSGNVGAAIYFANSNSNLTNCTMIRNTAKDKAGAGLNFVHSSPKIVNSIIWENSPIQISIDSSSSPAITYSDVDGGTDGKGNINSNPLFVDPAGQDFHLTSGSPCVNIGSNSAPYLPTTDKDGNARIWNTVVDMGVYEYQGCPLPGAVGLVSPAGSETAASPTYTWKMDSNATYYFLWVDDSTGNKVKLWYTTAQANCNASTGLCSVTPQVALSEGTVLWWIQTWNSCGYGPWSASASFNAGPLPGAAILASPKGLNISTTPTYTWNAVASATYYSLWVRDYTGFPRIQTWYTAAEVGCASGTGTCSIKPTITLFPGNAQWWVRTYNANGYGPWSDEMNFTVTGAAAPGKATLISPTGTIATVSPIFKWNAVPSTSWYYLYVQDSTSFWGRITAWFNASQAGCAAGTGTCSITPNSVLAPGAGTWWIRTWNDLGTGPWSDGMTFTVPGASSSSPEFPEP